MKAKAFSFKLLPYFRWLLRLSKYSVTTCRSTQLPIIKILIIQGLFNFPQDIVPGKILLKYLNINSSTKFLSLWILLFINTKEQGTILL